MPFYLAAFFIYIAIVFRSICERKNFTFLQFIFALFPLFLITILRGDIGTDTAAYLNIISDMQKGLIPDMEWGFVMSVKSMLFLGFSSRDILIIFSFLISGFIIYAASFSSRSLLILVLCIVPIFFWDMTMNGLRYGLAFSLAMCSIANYYKENYRLVVIFAVSSILFHVSGLLIFILMILVSDNGKELKNWLIITIGLSLLLVIFQSADYISNIFANDDNLIGALNMRNKFSGYAAFPSPSLLSGLVPMILSFLALAILKIADAAPKRIRICRFYILLVSVLLTFFLAKFSYAGLRLQFLVLFFIFVCLQFKPAFSQLDFAINKKNILPLFLLISTLGFVAFFKNALTSEGLGPSPWLPYSFSPAVNEYFDFLPAFYK